MDTRQPRSFHKLAGGALALLDISVLGFYALWFVAHDAAVDRSEEHGFDPQQLLANAYWLWAFANATLVCLIALNVILIVGWRRSRRREQLALPGPRPVEG
ncbi:MAG: cell surface protein [Actinomyces ruminicola]|nr:cell surface protein [Actinomyces ruminicola]